MKSYHLRPSVFMSFWPARLLCVLGVLSIAPTVTRADSYGYFQNRTSYVRSSLVSPSTQTFSAAGDDTSHSVSIGFNFSFYGQNYSTIHLNSNGFASFGGSSLPSFINQNLTTSGPSVNRPIIAPFWDDLKFTPGGGRGIYSNTVGTPGARRFYAEWWQVEPFSTSPSG